MSGESITCTIAALVLGCALGYLIGRLIAEWVR
jgi:hypothetical protein